MFYGCSEKGLPSHFSIRLKKKAGSPGKGPLISFTLFPLLNTQNNRTPRMETGFLYVFSTVAETKLSAVKKLGLSENYKNKSCLSNTYKVSGLVSCALYIKCHLIFTINLQHRIILLPSNENRARRDCIIGITTSS